jgi:hypothetical protein
MLPLSLGNADLRHRFHTNVPIERLGNIRRQRIREFVTEGNPVIIDVAFCVEQQLGSVIGAPDVCIPRPVIRKLARDVRCGSWANRGRNSATTEKKLEHLPNALVQLQARYHHCVEAAFGKVLVCRDLRQLRWERTVIRTQRSQYRTSGTFVRHCATANAGAPHTSARMAHSERPTSRVPGVTVRLGPSV